MANRKHDWNSPSIGRAAQEATSLADLLRKLGIPISGSNYASLKAALERQGIDPASVARQGWRGGRTFPRERQRSLAAILVEDSDYTSTYDLKRRLWREGLLPRRCQACGITEWRGRPAPLQLDHINGIRRDNRITNLRILCPNCHAQTDTWTGRNKGRATSRARGAATSSPRASGGIGRR